MSTSQRKGRRTLGITAAIVAVGLLVVVAATGSTTMFSGNPTFMAAAQQQGQTDLGKKTSEEKPTVSTSGIASMDVTPDKVSLSIGVETNGTKATDAASKNSQVMQNVIDSLKGLGINGSQIATSSYTVLPIYSTTNPLCIQIYPKPPECNPKSEITGYRAINSITVTLNATSNIGKVIDTAIGAGANNVSSASFFISEQKQQQIRDSLIEQAVDNAKSRAEKAASAVNLKITGVKSLNLNDIYFPVAYRDLRMDANVPAPTPIVPGLQQITMNVQAVFTMG